MSCALSVQLPESFAINKFFTVRTSRWWKMASTPVALTDMTQTNFKFNHYKRTSYSRSLLGVINASSFHLWPCVTASDCRNLQPPECPRQHRPRAHVSPRVTAYSRPEGNQAGETRLPLLSSTYSSSTCQRSSNPKVSLGFFHCLRLCSTNHNISLT